MKQQADCHRDNLLCKQNSNYTHGISAKKWTHPTSWHPRKPQLQASDSQSNANILALKKISPEIKTFFFLSAWSISIKHTDAGIVYLPCPNQLSGYSGDTSHTAELVCWRLLTCFPSKHCLYFFFLTQCSKRSPSLEIYFFHWRDTEKKGHIKIVAFKHQNSFSTLVVHFLEGLQVVFYYTNLIKHTCKKDGTEKGKETDTTSDSFFLFNRRA